jgi:2-C-methyl-D-erythritol 4-phosphate cytidylyltransferase
MHNRAMPESNGRFVTALLLAGGSGTRLGATVPKQFLQLGDERMFVHSLKVFEGCSSIDAVILVLPNDRSDEAGDLNQITKLVACVDGGPTRQASLAEGLVGLPELTDVVVVHDAARPALTADIVTRTLEGLEEGFPGCIPVITMEDAVKEVSLSHELVKGRSKVGLYRAQTPQVFLREPLEDCLARCDAEGFIAEDCSEMLTRYGFRVNTVEGDSLNIKVTTLRDLALCEAIISSRRTSGSGH